MKIDAVSDEDGFFDETVNMIISSNNTKDFLLIDPNSTGKAAWEVAGLFMIIYQSIAIPYRLCFEDNAKGGWRTLEDIIDFCFLLDILVNFNTGFYKKGHLNYSRKDIVINYCKTWFLIDLVASFPYNWIIDEEVVDQDASLKTP